MSGTRAAHRVLSQFLYVMMRSDVTSNLKQTPVEKSSSIAMLKCQDINAIVFYRGGLSSELQYILWRQTPLLFYSLLLFILYEPTALHRCSHTNPTISGALHAEMSKVLFIMRSIVSRTSRERMGLLRFQILELFQGSVLSP